MTDLRQLLKYLLPAALGIAAACSADGHGLGSGSGSDGTTGSGASSGDGGSSAMSGTGTGMSGSGGDGDIFGDGGLTGSGGGGGGSGDDCADEAKLVYVIGQDNQLYSFYPPTLEVKLIGVINCPSAGATPFSMAVDRKGVAWIVFSDGKLYNVDVKTAACTPTTYAQGQSGFFTFGMGYVSNAVGSSAETLFVADYSGKGLAKIDTTALALQTVGPWDQLSGAAELTGTGDGRLFGFFQASPIIIAEIDKTNGKILSQAPQPSVNIGFGWAFAFWGGDFWLFTSPTGTSQIDRYRPADGTTVTVKTGLGTNIVGAGVSTCAPVAPPK